MTIQDNIKNNTFSKSNLLKLNNKFGAMSYGLFVLAAFFPFMTIEMWGMKESIPGTEVISTSVIALMLAGVALCLSGAAKWLAKGIAIFSIGYFYYELFCLYSEAKETFGGMSQLNDLSTMLGGSARNAIHEAAPSMFSKFIDMLSVGFWLMLTSFISMKFFVFMPYTESTLWSPVNNKLAEWANKATEKANEKIGNQKRN